MCIQEKIQPQQQQQKQQSQLETKYEMKRIDNARRLYSRICSLIVVSFFLLLSIQKLVTYSPMLCSLVVFTCLSVSPSLILFAKQDSN